MKILIVVNDPADWPLAIEEVEVVAARTYLTSPVYADLQQARVFNLCRSYKYQSTGYYVSLLATARGHKPLPDVTTIQDFKSQAIIRIASEDIDRIIQHSLAQIKSSEFTLSIYFGHNLAKCHEHLAQELFKIFQAPFLRAIFFFNEKQKKWQLQSLSPIAANDIPEEHRPFTVEMAREYFKGKHRGIRRKRATRYDLAILHDPDEQEAPSSGKALQKFIKAAEGIGVGVELITRDDYGRIAEFDALFIRETTSVMHHTYRFARRAAALGLVVIDDPESILKCTNKVFLAEIMTKNKVPTPKTAIVHSGNWMSLAENIGFPCILKKPDSSFSQGVVKVESKEELAIQAPALLQKSELIIAQEFMPTTFDWRIGVFDKKPLFACKYFMAKKHWQIIKRDDAGHKILDGNFETMPVEDCPPSLIRLALKATALIGDGLYGVDIKQVDSKFYLIEINDNPNIDAGVEDKILKDELYARMMRVFAQRLDARRRGSGW
ncbi:MAG: RimK family protein [Desulfobulbaceae bacterium]|nr:RimK family protein [Desulfobulbaceae bacterium]HIJ79102.1 RimK family protein [Deltaproteobacteria bacterium]